MTPTPHRHPDRPLAPALDLAAARTRADRLCADPDPQAQADGCLISALVARVRQLALRCDVAASGEGC